MEAKLKHIVCKTTTSSAPFMTRRPDSCHDRGTARLVPQMTRVLSVAPDATGHETSHFSFIGVCFVCACALSFSHSLFNLFRCFMCIHVYVLIHPSIPIGCLFFNFFFWVSVLLFLSVQQNKCTVCLNLAFYCDWFSWRGRCRAINFKLLYGKFHRVSITRLPITEVYYLETHLW